MLVLVLISLCLLPATRASAQQNKDWNKRLLYKATANLTCEDAEFDPLEQQRAHYQWLLPSGKVIGRTVLTTQDDRYSFINNGSTLIIRDIEKYDFGIYFCLVATDHQPPVFRAIKIGVNVDGPYFGDLWERYQPNLRMGLLASAVTFVVMSMFCYNHNQFQSIHDKPIESQDLTNKDNSVKTNPDGNNPAHYNLAFVLENDHPDRGLTTDAHVEPNTKF